MKTYLDETDKPLIRSCINCVNFKPIAPNDHKTGYCTAKPMMFAYTMEYNVYAIVKSFCLCNDHLFENETYLKENCRQVEMKSILVNKNVVGKKR